MDLDRDGRSDLLSGSYLPGDLYLFPGRESGGFGTPRVLADVRGEPLRVGRAAWPFATDWEGDGDVDLVVGNMYGHVFLCRNPGGASVLAWAAPAPLEAAGAPLVLTATNASPCVADWDGDGARDLLLGAGDGAVRFYRNTSRGGEPALAAPLFLVPPAPAESPPVGRTGPGRRTRLATCDWNDDGRLDLLVGEHVAESGPAPALTPAQQHELDAAIQEGVALATRRGELERAASARWLAAKGIPASEASTRHDDFLVEWLATDEARAVTQRQDELAAVQARLSPALLEHGRVWVFVRRGG